MLAAITGLVEPVWAMVAMAVSVGVVLTNSFAGRIVSSPRHPVETSCCIVGACLCAVDRQVHASLAVMRYNCVPDDARNHYLLGSWVGPYE